MNIKNASLGGLAFTILFTWAVFVVDMMFFPTILLIAIPSVRVTLLRREYISYFHGVFTAYIAVVIQYVCGVKITIYSKDPDIFKERANTLIICNHRTRIDWMFAFYYYCAIIDMGAYSRIILKDALKSVPIHGWAMQQCLYIFLQRSRDADVPHIYNVMSYLLKTSQKVALLLFPEGTDLSDSNIAKSNVYAREHNLPEYKYVLHPKPTGFFVTSQALRHHGGCVHDITMGYHDVNEGQRPDEKALLLGLQLNGHNKISLTMSKIENVHRSAPEGDTHRCRSYSY